MHYEKEVTSQVQPQPKRYFSASACKIDRRTMLLCRYSFKHVEHTFRKIKARVSLALQLTLNTFTARRLRLKSMNLPYDLGGCAVRKNEVPSHAQTCDVLYLTFQRLGDRDIAKCYPTFLCFRRKALSCACKFSESS